MQLKIWVRFLTLQKLNYSWLCIWRFHIHEFNQPWIKNIRKKCHVAAGLYYVVRLMTVASVLNMYRPFFSSHHSLPGVSILRPMGHMRPRMTMNEAQHKINLFKTFFAHQFSLVFVYLMCGQRQLFFFQCGQRRQKVGHPSYVAFTLY